MGPKIVVIIALSMFFARLISNILTNKNKALNVLFLFVFLFSWSEMKEAKVKGLDLWCSSKSNITAATKNRTIEC